MRRNLDFIRGQTFSFSGVLRDASGPVDLTNAALQWRMGLTDLRRTTILLTESDGISVASGTGGAWTITVNPDKTADAAAGEYNHQGTATIGTAVYNLVSGRVRLLRDLPT
ncbi:hypothetical protein HBA54_04165 [Pelagibius litoralis]|uniref:Uncharacterized protein n=1 Tax=Pelagibius litoralis TaxID=374515 RepID=A0A967C7H3_9PROT|nr:hypothetical protein [Pelagibius litoralis]NIA67777.1 hypothetical protein [Pelagibius litoralis]